MMMVLPPHAMRSKTTATPTHTGARRTVGVSQWRIAHAIAPLTKASSMIDEDQSEIMVNMCGASCAPLTGRYHKDRPVRAQPEGCGEWWTVAGIEPAHRQIQHFYEALQRERKGAVGVSVITPP